MKPKTRLLIVGGFLGAGKTTLLRAMAKRLTGEGKTVGLITNDQAPGLVDTTLLKTTGAMVAEVSSGCFCCNFNSFTDSIKELGNITPVDYIIAEPVGSCADLSATIIQPLKELYNKELEVLPLTVLADPARLTNLMPGKNRELHPSATYILHKQLEESDVIAVTKVDTIDPGELSSLREKLGQIYPGREILALSSITGAGIESWFRYVQLDARPGQRVIDVDYDIYAEGEAILGWLNATITLKGKDVNWDEFGREFLAALGNETDLRGLNVGHVKLVIESNGNQFMANLTGNATTLNRSGKAGISGNARLIFNARVETSPVYLENLVKETLLEVTRDKVTLAVEAWNCLSPAYPKPTHRYNRVV